MFRISLFCSLALAAVTPAADNPRTLTDEEKKEGFVSLFNGKDFTGWRFTASKADNWKVEDGLIKLSGGGSPHLASAWDYEDFDFRFEWRSVKANYNSGFYVRSGRNVGSNQLNLAKGAEGALIGGKGKGAKAVPTLQNQPMEWNEWRVKVVGDKLTFWCNGKHAFDATDWSPARGYMGLQAEGAALEFRNFRVKELGYDSLMDPKFWAGESGWKQSAAEWSTAEGGSVKTKRNDYRNYVLRLEYSGDPGEMGAVLLRGQAPAGVLHLNPANAGSLDTAKNTKKVELAKEGWNYLETRVAGDKVSVWINGVFVLENHTWKAPEPGPIGIVSAGKVAFRNIRLREIKE